MGTNGLYLEIMGQERNEEMGAKRDVNIRVFRDYADNFRDHCHELYEPMSAVLERLIALDVAEEDDRVGHISIVPRRQRLNARLHFEFDADIYATFVTKCHKLGVMPARRLNQHIIFASSQSLFQTFFAL